MNTFRSSISEAVNDLIDGKMIIVTDDEDRENEGDLVLLSNYATPEAINFMATYGRGLICLTVTKHICKQLQLYPMVPPSQNKSSNSTQFMVSIEAKEGVTTGISAKDRAHTILVAIDPKSTHEDIVSPGHIFPLLAQDGGVLVRAGHTEAGLDLAKLAKAASHSAVICEILNPDGSMARKKDLIEYAKIHSLKMISIQQIIEKRLEREFTVEKISEEPITCPFGNYTLTVFKDLLNDCTHYSLHKGVINSNPVLARVHVADFLIDTIQIGKQNNQQVNHSALYKALDVIQKHSGSAVLVVLFKKQNHLREPANPIVERKIGLGSQILKSLGVQNIVVLGAPKSYPGLTGFGLNIVDHIEF
ncbi:MAG: 3,4-dihydroxy-2-butanone-4-phosphate synthase [Methylacidiphilales bacterium]|nr:3,4-dihydroxy-2-butanone-4-phosphate synthase [Candidatus Methylacidiphilales bacterium]